MVDTLVQKEAPIVRSEKNSLNIKFGGGYFPGTSGTQTSGYPGQNFMQLAFFCCFRQGVAGMSRDLGRDVPDLEKLYARKLWADFRPLRDFEDALRIPRFTKSSS